MSWLLVALLRALRRIAPVLPRPMLRALRRWLCAWERDITERGTGPR